MSDDLALTQTQNWGSYSHQELYDAIHQDNNPGEVGTLAGQWVGLAGEITDHAQRMTEKIKATQATWQGSAGTAARGAMDKLATWSHTTAQTASDLGQQVSDQSQIVEKARAAMPEPVTFDWQAELKQGFAEGGIAGFVQAAADVKAKNAEATAAHEQAVQVMSTMETESKALDAKTLRWAGRGDLLDQRRVGQRRSPVGVAGAMAAGRVPGRASVASGPEPRTLAGYAGATGLRAGDRGLCRLGRSPKPAAGRSGSSPSACDRLSRSALRGTSGTRRLAGTPGSDRALCR